MLNKDVLSFFYLFKDNGKICRNFILEFDRLTNHGQNYGITKKKAYNKWKKYFNIFSLFLINISNVIQTCGNVVMIFWICFSTNFK